MTPERIASIYFISPRKMIKSFVTNSIATIIYYVVFRRMAKCNTFIHPPVQCRFVYTIKF